MGRKKPLQSLPDENDSERIQGQVRLHGRPFLKGGRGAGGEQCIRTGAQGSPHIVSLINFRICTCCMARPPLHGPGTASSPRSASRVSAGAPEAPPLYVY